MNTLMPTVLILLSAESAPADAQEVGREIWERVSSMVERTSDRNSPEMINYLRSLKSEEAIAAARHGCKVADEQPGATEETRLILAGKNSLLCLQTFLDGPDFEVRAQELIRLVGSSDEPDGLRSAIAGALAGPSKRFAVAERLHEYALANLDAVEQTLVSALADRNAGVELRRRSIVSISSLYRRQLEKVIEDDPNVARMKRQMQANSQPQIPVLEIVVSGKVMLAPETLAAQQAIELRIVKNAELLASIVSQPDNPEQVRTHARGVLGSYQKLPLTRIKEVDEAVLNADSRK